MEYLQKRGLVVFVENSKRVLIGSQIQQKPQILREFLLSLGRLNLNNVQFGYCFIDDNTDRESSSLLQEFAKHYPSVVVLPSNMQNQDHYLTNETTHYWNEQLIWKVAMLKNTLIQTALDYEYDYLFLIDSDILLHPYTLNQLIDSGKDIVSEVFWTRWHPDLDEQPQVWLTDEYTQHIQHRQEILTNKEVVDRRQQFFDQLRIPGLYEVGGLGACTLLSKSALSKGINFHRIKNLSFLGEDRHFCIRATALGFLLYVDTHYPAFHIYRESDLARIDNFWSSCEVSMNQRVDVKKVLMPLLGPKSSEKRRITLSMVFKNEANRYLRTVLEEHKHYIDTAVIIDDGSTDDSVAICCKILDGIPLTIVKNTESKFSNEVQLRTQQWQETIKTNPEWILNLDADEMFEPKFRYQVRQLIDQEAIDVCHFRLFDFWNATHYREDVYWCAHTVYRPFLVRYRENHTYRFKDTAQHCGRFPENIFSLPSGLSDIRLKHFGWANVEDRKFKYERYMRLDPGARFGWKEQYESILDGNPNLVEWRE